MCSVDEASGHGKVDRTDMQVRDHPQTNTVSAMIVPPDSGPVIGFDPVTRLVAQSSASHPQIQESTVGLSTVG